MTFIELLLIAIALSMDAFAVSICYGIKNSRFNLRHTLIVALFFGFFQFLMPLIGWGLSSAAHKYIEAYDHWVAFFMLAGIGLKMTWDAVKEDNKDDDCGGLCTPEFMGYKTLLWLSIATSIDALAAGVTFGVMSGGIIFPCTVIGLTTFAFSFVGMKFGAKIGRFAGKKFAFLGGVVLVVIGIKILVEHLFFN